MCLDIHGVCIWHFSNGWQAEHRRGDETEQARLTQTREREQQKNAPEKPNAADKTVFRIYAVLPNKLTLNDITIARFSSYI